MDSISPATSNVGSLSRTITKILRFHRNTNLVSDQDDEIHKLKSTKSSEDRRQSLFKDEVEKPENEAVDSLIANLFTSIFAIKAAYAQLQFARAPYDDPKTIHYADQVVVTELKHLSKLKHAYFKNQIDHPRPPPLNAQIEERRNLLKTYKITTKKLKSEIKFKDSEISSLQAQLMEIGSIDGGLHLFSLHLTNFLAAFRYTIRSIRSFVKLMVGEMDSAGWDLDAAAKSIQPDIPKKPGHNLFAFESFICQKLFCDFHRRDFGLSHMEDRVSWESQQFFTEYTVLKSVKAKKFLLDQKGRLSGFGKFCRAKYLTIVHPKMEASFFGDLDHRGLVSSGRAFPESEFFLGFAEMVRRVSMLHCLFFSHGREVDVSIFQVKGGCRFSEVYMENVVEEKEVDGTAVGFTVMPGFRIGRTIIQCKVYLSGWMENGRS